MNEADPMTPEELEAIRRRVQDADDNKWQGRTARRDRAALLAEVDRLRALLVEVGDTYDFEIDLTTGELS